MVLCHCILHSCRLHYSHFLFPKSFSRRIPMAEKSKILIIGGTGYIGKFIVEASVQSGHRTFTLVRESTVSDPAKAKLIDSFKNSGSHFAPCLYTTPRIVTFYVLIYAYLGFRGCMSGIRNLRQGELPIHITPLTIKNRSPHDGVFLGYVLVVCTYEEHPQSFHNITVLISMSICLIDY